MDSLRKIIGPIGIIALFINGEKLPIVEDLRCLDLIKILAVKVDNSPSVIPEKRVGKREAISKGIRSVGLGHDVLHLLDSKERTGSVMNENIEVAFLLL